MSEKSSLEIAGDITIAMIGKLVLEKRASEGIWEVTPEALAPRIAEAFKVIYQAVKHPG